MIMKKVKDNNASIWIISFLCGLISVLIYGIILEIILKRNGELVAPFFLIPVIFIIGFIISMYRLIKSDQEKKIKSLENDIKLFFSDMYILEGNKVYKILTQNLIKLLNKEIETIDYNILCSINLEKEQVIFKLENLSKRLTNRAVDLDYINFIVVIVGVISISGISIGENSVNNLLISVLLCLLLIYFLKRNLDFKYWKIITNEIDYIKYQINDNYMLKNYNK